MILIVDTNLLLLLVIGAADPRYIRSHKRVRDDYTVDDFLAIEAIASRATELVLLQPVLVEVSNLAWQIENPARSNIRSTLARLIERSEEIHLPSAAGVARAEFVQLGLTDAIILAFFAIERAGLGPTLLTADRQLAARTRGLGRNVICYSEL